MPGTETHIYGIKNCDTMKKAFAWLDAHGVPYTFHDYKKEGVVAQHLDHWCEQLGWEALLNTRGLMWRKIEASEKADLNEATARALMIKYPSVIKRPVVQHPQGRMTVGFSEDGWRQLLPSSHPT